MKIPDDVLRLIHDEQSRQDGKYIQNSPCYLEKLSNNAELALHYQPEGLGGYVFFYCNEPGNKISFISLIGTAYEMRGKGIGGALISYVLSISKLRGFERCELEVLENNIPALRLYKKFGFNRIEYRGTKLLLAASI